jgi:HEAT repeat protein
MILRRISFLALLLVFTGLPLHAQDAKPDLAELWETGSLWAVGDNRAVVKDAREKIIAAGEDGLKFALTKMGTLDTKHVRCMRAVFAGLGKNENLRPKVLKGLEGKIPDDNATVRRNAAELLSLLKDKEAAPALLAQAKVEESLGAKLQQLSALAKWKNEDAVPLIIELSRNDVDRIRHRVTGLLGSYETRDAVFRLIEMLDDDIYYVRDGARNALVKSTPAARSVCLSRLQKQFKLPAGEQNIRRVRLLLPIIAGLANDAVPQVLQQALKHESGLVRGDAAAALVTWKSGAGLMDTKLDVTGLLDKALEKESDPYAKAGIEAARKKLDKPDKK